MSDTNQQMMANTGATRSGAFRDSPRLDEWLGALVQQRGSDLLLVSGVPASIRFEGRVQPLEGEALTGPEIEAALLPILTPRAQQQYREHNITDVSYRV